MTVLVLELMYRERAERVVPTKDCSGRKYSADEREDMIRYVLEGAEIQRDMDAEYVTNYFGEKNLIVSGAIDLAKLERVLCKCGHSIMNHYWCEGCCDRSGCGCKKFEFDRIKEQDSFTQIGNSPTSPLRQDVE